MPCVSVALPAAFGRVLLCGATPDAGRPIAQSESPARNDRRLTVALEHLHTIRTVDGDDESTDSASPASALRGHFTRLMFDLCDRFKREIDYNPTRFREMVGEHGGPEAARRLLHGRQVQTGLETLAWHGRLAESVEAHVLQPRFAPLFSDDDRRIARKRLEGLGFDVNAYVRSLA
jgi:hypothetical protein